MTLNNIKKELQQKGNKEKAKILQRFFKTGKGEYGEGDIFLGISVPEQRNLANKYKNLPLTDIQTLLESKIHEHRLTALIILTLKYPHDKKTIYNFYIKNKQYINNWDLVDITCPKIVGDYLLDKDKSILYKFAKSYHLWTKRIAILATFTFIKNNQYDDTLKISKILLNDKHDLIHKAVGWMLREVGKKDQNIEEKFLIKHYKTMPRTMLRYAIEKFNEKKRKFYMQK